MIIKMQIIIFFAFFINFIACLFEECVEPPMECPNKNITYWLYTKKNADDPHQLFIEDPTSIKSAPWVDGAPIKVLIHGYTGHKDYSPNTEIRPAYLECCDYNIISIDYNPIAQSPCYPQAANNTELVGMCTAKLIDELVTKYSFALEKFHIIGFSLGGQVAGFIGNYLTCGRLSRITALDPALPLFATTDKDNKIDAGDALFVDALHTNALLKGKLEPCGHIDFYANGGLSQPGCRSTLNRTKSSCDHARAPEYFAESITTKNGCYGYSCSSWISYMIGWCELVGSAGDVLFGEYVPYNSSGLYFFSTNSESPYCRGENKKVVGTK